MSDPTCLPATGVTSTGGVANGNADNIPVNQFLRVSYALTAGGPYVNNGLNEPGSNTLDQPASVFAGAAPGTTIYYVVQELDTDGSTVLAQSTECSFMTTAIPGSSFQPTPCTNCGGGTGGVDPPAQDVEQLLLCDIGPDGSVLGTALMVTAYDDSSGLPLGPPSPVDPATGAPYVVQGTLQPCDKPCVTCDRLIMCDNTVTEGETVVTSTMVMLDTPNVAGDDGWNVTGYNTSNSPNEPGSPYVGAASPPLPVPYPAIYTADVCTAWQAGVIGQVVVCPDSTTGPGLLVRANAVSTDCGSADDYDTSCARYTVEKTFNTGADCTQIRVTSQNFKADGAAKVLVDGQQTGIFGDYNSPSPDGTIILNVSPGAHIMTIDLRDAGPPTWIKGGLTIECLDITEAGVETVQFLRTTCRTCDGTIASVEDTTLDGSTPYVPTGDSITVCGGGGSGGGAVTNCANCTTNVLVDRRTNQAGNAICTYFLQRVCFACDNGAMTVTNTLMDGVSPYAPVGVVATDCNSDDCVPLVLAQVCVTSTDLPGVVLPASAVRACDGSVAFVNPATGLPWTGTLTVVVCPPDNQLTEEILCDQGNGNLPFRRIYTLSSLGGVVVADEDFDGDPYVVTGPAVNCGTQTRDSETEILCDSTGTQFLRKYVYDGEDATFVGIVSTTLDGNTPFVPVGAVSACDGGCSNASTVLLCDAPTDGTLTIETAIVDATTASVGQAQFANRATPYAPLWTGGALVYPAGAGPGQEHLGVTGKVSAAPAGCETASGMWNVSVRVTQNGPGTGQLWDGALRLFDGTTILADVPAMYYAPPGYQTTLSASVPVTAAQLASGNLGVMLALETFHGTAKSWTADQFTSEVELTGCASTSSVQFLRTLVTDCETGAITSTTDTDLDGAPYVVTGEVEQCAGVTIPEPACCPDANTLQLCDSANGTAFLRNYVLSSTGQVTSFIDTDLLGAPYLIVGDAVQCGANGDTRDTEVMVLCDATPTRFLRKYLYDGETGAFVSVVNTTLDGTTPFVPVGAVGVCSTPVSTDLDFVVIELCDNNGGFLRRFTFNSTTGAVTTTTNTTLAGAAYVPVGSVGICDGCCPTVVGQGCINTGSGKYVAIRSAAGVVSLFDAVSGAAVLPAAVIACADDNLVKTLTAQARLLTNAAPWTPADVAGTLTSLSVTGLGGLWDLVDQNGTVLTGLPAGLTLTWSALDDNTLTGPTSVTPQAGSSVVANWTQR